MFYAFYNYVFLLLSPFSFASGYSFPLFTMHIFCSGCTIPVKLKVSFFVVFIFIIYYNKINYTAFTQQSQLPVVGVVRFRGSTLQPVDRSPGHSGPNCPPGFYTKEELKPHPEIPGHQVQMATPLCHTKCLLKNIKRNYLGLIETNSTSLPVIASPCTVI